MELRRIGVNLNQLAQQMNRVGSPDRREILSVLELLAGAVADVTMKVIGADGGEQSTTGEQR